MIRCAFCGKPYQGPYERKQPGVQTVKCHHCHRAFIILITKRWWGFERTVHVR